jgi:endonuclease/exonuclease/phosphatase (EEP) superfamily protein YafD/TM2 domain-containing membrane protein YozV
MSASGKSLLMAYVLWAFLGWTGAHRFYLGRPGSAMLMLGLSVVSMVLMIVMVGILGYAIVLCWWIHDGVFLPAMFRQQRVREFFDSRAVGSRKSISTLGLVWFVGFLHFNAFMIFLLGRFGPEPVEALASPWTWHAAVVMALTAVGRLVLYPRLGSFLAIVAAAWGMAVALPIVMPDAPAAKDSGPDSRLRIVSFNVLVGNEPTREAIEWLLASDADILAVPECTTRWDEGIRQLGRWPHAVVGVDDTGPGGIGLYSRFPLRDGAVRTAPDAYFRHAEAVVIAPGGEVRVFAVHPPPPMGRQLTAARNTEMRWLASQVAASDLPVIVAGDFNETPFGRTFASFVDVSLLQPVAAVAYPMGTWPARWHDIHLSPLIAIPIDHVFASRHFTPIAFEVGPSVGSDHRPIVADVRWVYPAPAPLLSPNP